MDSNSRHQILKRLQTGLARGAPFDLTTLAQIGVSAPLAARYAESGWLVRLAQGVYAFPNDDFGVYGALMFLQQRVPGLHVGGKSALALQGVRHNLGGRETLVLWGDVRFTLPDWFTSRFPARYVYARLFDWPDEMLAAKTLVTPAGLPDGLHVSASERAVLELLYDVGTRQSLDEARNLFDGVRSPRKELMGQLLASCTNVKTVRLFVTWARESGLLDVDDLRARYPLRTGSDKRWMSRMPVLKRAEGSEDDDPVLGQFLGFLARDIANHPERLQAVGASLVQRLQSLVGDVEADLDTALSAEDE